jgi:hypothetical protein
VVRLFDLLGKMHGPAASATVALTRGLAALDVVLQQRRVEFRVKDFVADDVEGERILSQLVLLREHLIEALAEPQSLPNLAGWLNAIWDRFGVVTGQFFAEFVPKLREVSCHIATLSVWLAAPHQNRAPHQIVYGSFVLSLLSSGIFAPGVLKPSHMDLREWKKLLIKIFSANIDVGYEAAPLPPRNCMLVMILCTGSTASKLQEDIMHSVQDFFEVSGYDIASDPKLEAQTGRRSAPSIAMSDRKVLEICEGAR